MNSRARLACAAVVIVRFALAPPATHAAEIALPDTGLFATVAVQYDVHRRFNAEHPGAAARRDSLRGDARAIARLRAREALIRQDYAAARPLIEAMAKRPDETDQERMLQFEWLFAHDDAPQVDRLTRGISLARGTRARVPDLLAAGRLAYDLLNWDRADSCFTRAREAARDNDLVAAALTGRGRVLYRKLAFDSSAAVLAMVLRSQAESKADALEALGETLIRLGRTDEAISCNQWAVRLNPYHELAHYFLGNGYARKNYTELLRFYEESFPPPPDELYGALHVADSLLARGDRAGARKIYEERQERPVLRGGPHPAAIHAEAVVRLASLEFEDGHYDRARDLCFAALRLCPEYGRAHAILAKALEFQRFDVDVHRADYEKRFAAAPMPVIPGIDSFVVNWRSLSPRVQKRVALSVEPWKNYLPVLIAGGATFYVKPLYMLLSDCPGQETLHDQRINYDSRLWDDVRGAGGYHTVTGIEDVERTLFDRYNTVTHELTHQVHAVLPASESRAIQELYRRAKVRDDVNHDAIMSRYAAGSVYEYFAEGANALVSPKRDAYDPREVVRERLMRLDPGLAALERRLMAVTDVSASYPVAFVNAGDDHMERGQVDEAIAWYEKALARSPSEETALEALTRAFTRANRSDSAVAEARRALAAQPASGPIAAAAGDALWHGGRPLSEAIATLEHARPAVRPEERVQVDLALGKLRWVAGDAPGALAACDSVIAYQSDHPEGLWERAAALALAKRWDEAFAIYDRAVRIRTGVVELRCDYARDLLRAGRAAAARVQLDEARLLDAENARAEALRAWVDLDGGNLDAARAHVKQALAWGPWSDLARIVGARIEAKAGRGADAAALLAPVRDRIAKRLPPESVYRPKLAVWESVHELPAVERELLAGITAP